MNLWILSHLRDSPGNALALAAARARGHAAQLVDPLQIHIDISRGLWGEPGRLSPPDLVFTRMGSSAPPEALLPLRWLEATGIPCFNRASAIARTRDKTEQMLRLAQAGVPVPESLLVGAPPLPPDLPERIPGPPWIVKLPVSTQGAGVALAESWAGLRALCDTLRAAGHTPLVQRFVRDAAGADVRVLVVGGKARAAMRRKGRAGEFRSNLHRGGSAEALALSDTLAGMAERSARALGLDIAGVDVLESSDGPLVVEVNASPGLEGLSRTTGHNAADIVFTFLEAHNAHPSRRRTRPESS